ncbi:hypothetical protein EJ06DRAFT_556813 [Trichodelitschia bisporula]|uniref:Uncharacterized protein n=1 Tax=Trichodelitschia bisporula TaxID=703511 RepID=A0A6G1HXQ1_9PEZI|nr:hypothetical protein EJ06DRAFT_556813 [Trichodelitschia bisporula]
MDPTPPKSSPPEPSSIPLPPSTTLTHTDPTRPIPEPLNPIEVATALKRMKPYRNHGSQPHHHKPPPPQQPPAPTLPPNPALPRPPSKPFSGDNPDALALRSTLSILQLQRQQAERDMVALARQRDAALRDPEAFVAEVQRRGGKSEGGGAGGVLGPTLAGVLRAGRGGEEESGGNGEGKEGGVGRLPVPQNVVRAPPINWAKYGVVGAGLERIHEDLKARPVEGVPEGVLEGNGGAKREAYVLAAPYSPFADEEKLKQQVKMGEKQD